VVGETGQFFFFFLSFSRSCLVSSSLSEVWLVLRFQRLALWPTSHPALELSSYCVGVLGACYFAHTLSQGQGQSSINQLHVVRSLFWFCWLFFNFLILFDFGCNSLVQQISFVDCYLPYFRQQLISCLLSAHLPFFTESSCRDQHLAPPLFFCVAVFQLSTFPGFVYWKFPWGSTPCLSPLLLCTQFTLPHVLDVPFQFLVCYSVFFPCLLFSFFWGGLWIMGVSLSREHCWFIPGVAVVIPHATYWLACWSVSPKQVWSQCLAVQ
jgi:hypothetical protein